MAHTLNVFYIAQDRIWCKRETRHEGAVEIDENTYKKELLEGLGWNYENGIVSWRYENKSEVFLSWETVNYIEDMKERLELALEHTDRVSLDKLEQTIYDMLKEV